MTTTPHPLAPSCCRKPMDDHRITAVNGGVRLGFRCLKCEAETELFKPYRPETDAPEPVANRNGANGHGDPAGANGARQNGSKPKLERRTIHGGRRSTRVPQRAGADA